jgi:hypothetical protein
MGIKQKVPLHLRVSWSSALNTLKWMVSATMAQDDAIARLARQIDATHRAERFLVRADEIAVLRRQGAYELLRLSADFVSSVNGKLSQASLELSPPTYSLDAFRESEANLIQIASHGRQMQVLFEATSNLVSTEKFVIPYVVEGEVRTYNQKMLERFDVRTLSIFFCVEEKTTMWRFFDWRTRSTGIGDSGLLASLMEPLF